MPARMQAMVQEAYGSAEVMHVRDIDRPEISANEVLIRVRGAGVNPGDWAKPKGMIERESKLQLECWRHANRLSGRSEAGTGPPDRLERPRAMRAMLSPSDVQMDK
jgi:hypothetical protein